MKTKKALYIVGFVLLALLFSALVLTSRETDAAVYIGGVAPLTVKTDSMAPTFCKGDLIFVRRADPQQLQVGDVVCFRQAAPGGQTLSTHRIISIAAPTGVHCYTTCGDNKQFVDQRAHVDGDVVGIYIGRIPGAGAFLDRLGDGFAIISLILLPLVVLMVLFVCNTVARLRELKASGRSEEPPERQTVPPEVGAALAQVRATMQEANRIRAEADATWEQAARSSRQNAEKPLCSIGAPRNNI